MSAHSKTPYITPSMIFSSRSGVVRGRRAQQLEFTLEIGARLPRNPDRTWKNPGRVGRRSGPRDSSRARTATLFWGNPGPCPFWGLATWRFWPFFGLLEFSTFLSVVWHLRKLQSVPAPPVGSRHSCQSTVKLHILPLVWVFPLGKG